MSYCDVWVGGWVGESVFLLSSKCLPMHGPSCLLLSHKVGNSSTHPPTQS